MSADYDIAIIGSGFGGSLLAAIARRLGRSVLLLERGRHPRFAIGESTTPLSNLLLEELCARYSLSGLAPLCKWGSWQAAYPDIGCGLKRGFSFYHHRPGICAAMDPERQDQLLVAASPHDGIADTHWYRADVDALFLREALAAGVDYLDEAQLHSAFYQGDQIRLDGLRHARSLRVAVRFVVDATGPRGFLHRALALAEEALPDFPSTEGLYTHFRDVRRLDFNGDVPYPVDDAAVHHVFEGGWIWVLRFNNGITSAGVAATKESASEVGLHGGESAWRRLIERFPTIREQFASAVLERPFIHAPRLSFRSGVVAGERWALLPSAAGFVDPLLSTGFPMTLFGISRLAEIIERDWASPRFQTALAAYAARTDADLLATARLIGALYANMSNFPLFVGVSMIYFAAAVFSETARRLGKPNLASSFLLHDHPGFEILPILCRARHARTSEESHTLVSDIVRAIEPFNLAGLGENSRHNWYPAHAADLFRGAWKVDASRDDIARLLNRCGFWSAAACP